MTLIEQCNEILGESIFDHELIRFKPDLHFEIGQCKNMENVVAILNREYKNKHGRFLSLPGCGRNHYRKFIGENAKPIPPKKGVAKIKKSKRRPSIVGEYLKRHPIEKKVSTKQTDEDKIYLQRQTIDQVRLNQQVQRLLSQPSENFNYA